MSLLLLEHHAKVAIALLLRQVFRDQLLQRADPMLAVLARLRREVGLQQPVVIRASDRASSVAAVQPRPGIAPVDVAQRDDVVVEAEVEEVGPAHAADADAGDVEPIARRRLTTAEHVPRHNRDGRGGGGCRSSRSRVSRSWCLVLVPRAWACGPCLVPAASFYYNRAYANADHSQPHDSRRRHHRLRRRRRYGRESAHRSRRQRADARSGPDVRYAPRFEDDGVALPVSTARPADPRAPVRRVRRRLGRLDA